MSALTNNAIVDLIKNQTHDTDTSYQPVIQILKIQIVGSSTTPGSERYRVVLSDGTHRAQGMLNTQHNSRVHSKEIQDLSLIKVTGYMTNLVQKKNLIIILDFETVGREESKIGNPVEVPTIGEDGGAPQAAAPLYGNNNNNGNVNGQQQPVRVKPEQVKNGGNPYGGNKTNPYGNNNNNNNNNSNMNQNTYNNNQNTYNNGPVVRSADPISNRNFTPIASLNIYQQRWTLKARVTSKSEIRTWSNSKGEGSLFSIEIIDSSSHDIKCTFFREAVEKFHPMLEQDRVYTFSGGRLKSAHKIYNTCKSPHEITFDQNAEIHLEQDTGEIVQQSFEFRPIGSLEQVDPGQFVDIIGVVKSVSDPATIMSKKTGKEMTKCELTIVDDSGADVVCTVWGEKALKAGQEYANNPVVAARRARVSDYGGRTLSASSNGGITIRPRCQDTARIQRWWEQVGSTGGGNTRSLSSSGGGGAGRFPAFEERKTISAIKAENLGTNQEKPDWVSFKGSFSFIKSDKEGGAWYTACPNTEEPCKNRYKVAQQADGGYHCERCNRTYDNCVRRFIFSATVSDDTSTTWVSVFDDQARVLLDGISADELFGELNEKGQDAYDAYFAKATSTDWVFTCKVKQEMNMDEMRTKTSIHSVHPMDYAKEGRSLFNNILAMQ